MLTTGERSHIAPLLGLNMEDRFARERGVLGPHPRPIGPITYRIVARMAGGARQDLGEPLELIVARNGSGYDMWLGRVKQQDGTKRQAQLAEGTYVVRVETLFYQRREVTVPLPVAGISDAQGRQTLDIPTFDLEPGYAYPFPTESSVPGRGLTLLRGGVFHTDGQGRADARVEVVGVTRSYQTDTDGQWVLLFPDTQPSGNVTVRITFPDGTTLDVAGVAVEQGQERSLMQTALRGQVLRQTGVGIAGATVRITGYPGQSTTRPDGTWFYYFPLDQAADTVTVTVTLPDGSSQNQPNIPVQPRATVVVPAFRFP